jgi:hypothetical protein
MQAENTRKPTAFHYFTSPFGSEGGGLDYRRNLFSLKLHSNVISG